MMGIKGGEIEYRYVTDGHVACAAGTYALDDTSWIPLAIVSHSRLPKIDGLNADFDAVATPFGRFISVKGNAYSSAHLNSGKLSAMTSTTGVNAVFPQEVEVPAWVKDKVKTFALQRGVINSSAKNQVAAAEKAAPQD